MRVAIVVALYAGVAHADGAPLDLRIELRETVTLQAPGATSTFAIDEAIAEVSTHDGRITVVGRAVGSTTISVVTGEDVNTFALTVVAPPPWHMPGEERAGVRSWTVVQSDYESSSARLTDSLEIVDRTGRRTLRAYAVNVVKLDDQDADTRVAMPAMALEWRSGRDELVLLDKLIEHSPLTLDGTTVRGVHARIAGLEVHAGATSPLLYQSVFLSTQRELVLGASYELRRGRSALTPNLYAYPTPPQSGGSSGTMGSLLYTFATRDERLQLRAELGWGGVYGAAVELGYQDASQRAWFVARHEPRGFAALGIGRPLGSIVDGMWVGELGRRLGVSSAGTAARYELAGRDQEVATATGEVRYKLAPGVATSAGASLGRFRDDAMTAPVRSVTVPVGLHLDSRGLGGSAVYRYQANSARNRGGHGGRLGAWMHRRVLHASAFVDAQQEAATLELVLRDEPLLAQLLNELGLTASTPDELARLLRENATLSQLGYVQGVNLEFDPWRAQAGGELAWLAHDESRQSLRLRALIEETRGVSTMRRTKAVSLSYGRRLGSAVEANAMLSWWSRDDAMASAHDSWSVAAGVRVRIDKAPRIGGWGSHSIEGSVLDEQAAPVAGVTIRIDGGRTTKTDANGRFRFADLARGEHRVEADLPAEMYFTGPSRFTVDSGATVGFTLERTPAHVTGVVHDDTGRGLAGIAFSIRGELATRNVATDSSGRFRIALPAGDYVLEPVRDTFPTGYDVSDLSSTSLHVEAGMPHLEEMVAPAERSIAGTLRSTADDHPSVMLVELGRRAVVDSAGRYVFRRLSPGTYTVQATIGGIATTRTVTVGAEPAAIRSIDFP